MTFKKLCQDVASPINSRPSLASSSHTDIVHVLLPRPSLTSSEQSTFDKSSASSSTAITQEEKDRVDAALSSSKTSVKVLLNRYSEDATRETNHTKTSSKHKGDESTKKLTTETRVVKRTARKTVNKNKFVAEEMALVQKFRLKEKHDRSLDSTDIVQQNASVVSSKTEILEPATNKTISLQPTYRIVKNVPGSAAPVEPKSNLPCGSQASDTARDRQVAAQAFSSTDSLVDHVEDSISDVKESVSKLEQSKLESDHSAEDETETVSLKEIINSEAEPSNDSSDVANAFESADLNDILSAAGFDDTRVLKELGNQSDSTKDISGESTPGTTPVADGETQKWTKSLDIYAQKQADLKRTSITPGLTPITPGLTSITPGLYIFH